jgi:hypothetical protein
MRLVLYSVLLVLLASFALAMHVTSPSVENGLSSGSSDVMHIYFFQLDKSTGTFLDTNTWGKMTSDSAGLLINAHQLPKNTDYALTYLIRPSYNQNLTEKQVATGTVNPGGQLHMTGEFSGKVCGGWLAPASDPLCKLPESICLYPYMGEHGSGYGCD